MENCYGIIRRLKRAKGRNRYVEKHKPLDTGDSGGLIPIKRYFPAMDSHDAIYLLRVELLRVPARGIFLLAHDGDQGTGGHDAGHAVARDEHCAAGAE